MKKAKIHTLLVSMILVLMISVGGTVAYLITQTDPITNTFNPSQVLCEVLDPTVSDGTYTFTVKNTGDIAAYLRVAVVVNYVDDEGNIYYIAEAAPHEITADGWKAKSQSDGYYYYPTAVAPDQIAGAIAGDSTATEGGTITVKPATVTGYTPQVEVVAQAIQSVPIEAVKEAWGQDVPVTDNNDNTNSSN